MNRIIFFILSLCVLSFGLFGCATVPPSKAVLPIQHFTVNNTVYYPLSSACKYLNIPWDYDSFARQVTLNKSGTEVKLLVDSSMVLVNGSPLDIQEPILMHNGIISVPQKFKDKILDKYYSLISPVRVYPEVIAGKIKKVVIDPGHGGYDPGARGRSGLREKDANLDISRRLGKLFEASSINTVFTRSTDKFLSLEDRARIVNLARPDIFISVHSNASRSRKLSGFEVYYISENISDISRAADAAERYALGFDKDSFARSSFNLKAVLWDMLNTQNRAESIRLAQSICQSASQNMGLKILGVKGARFFVLKGACTPAVLVEVGFVSNSNEEKYLRNGFYRQQIAEAIFDGVINYSKKCDLAQASAN